MKKVASPNQAKPSADLDQSEPNDIRFIKTWTHYYLPFPFLSLFLQKYESSEDTTNDLDFAVKEKEMGTRIK